MSSLKSDAHRDFSVFDKLSTEELEEILRQDSMLPEAESDTEATLYILGVIEKREKENPTRDYPDVEAAWKEFNELYRPFQDPRPLWAEEDEPTPAVPAAGKPSTRRPTQHALRAAYVAAVIVALIFAGSLYGYAMGYDPWGCLARWTQETFHFAQATPESSGAAAHVLAGLEQLLAEHGITDVALPGYMPARYEETGLDYYDRSGGENSWMASYENTEGNTILITCRIVKSSEYTKDDADPEVYISRNGRQFYIFSNVGRHKAVWMNGNMECSISGLIEDRELKKIMESITQEVKS